MRTNHEILWLLKHINQLNCPEIDYRLAMQTKISAKYPRFCKKKNIQLNFNVEIYFFKFFTIAMQLQKSLIH
jgi:hypothetical protein